MSKKIKLKVVNKQDGDVRDPQQGGAHMHEPDDNDTSVTKMDGSHPHLFIIGDAPIVTLFDGEHPHPILEDGSLGDPEPHGHGIVVGMDEDNEPIIIFTEAEADHEHSKDFRFVFEGMHKHILILEDGSEHESLLPEELMDKNIMKGYHVGIQAIMMDKEKFTSFEAAAEWAEKNGFEITTLDDTGSFYTFRQLSRERFVEESIKEFPITDGVKALIGTLKETEETSHDSETGVTRTDTSFDRVRDLINQEQSTLDEDQLRKLDSLKDKYKKNMSELKARLNKIIPVLNDFIDLSSNLVENQDFVQFMDDFVASFGALTTDMNKLELAEMDIEQPTENFEKQLDELHPHLENVTKMFDDTSFKDFNELCKFALWASEKMLDKILKDLKGLKKSSKKIYKHFDTDLDFEIEGIEYIEKINVSVLSKMKIKGFDTGSVKFEKHLQTMWDKFVTKGSPLKLDLGCGSIKSDGYVGIDTKFTNKSDLNYDINEGIPFPSDSVDEVKADYSLQYVENSKREFIMKEIHRVLKKDGKLVCETPSTDGQNAFMPGYKSYWNEFVFKLFKEFKVVSMETKKDEQQQTAVVKCILEAVKDGE